MNLQLIKKLGEGSYGIVFLANSTDPNGNTAEVAIKKIEKNEKFLQNKKNINNEINILRFVNQCDYVDNIIKYYKFVETKEDYLLYFEYCNGLSLSNIMKGLRKLPSSKVRKKFEGIIQYYMRQIVEGIRFLHQHNIVHRDIKPDNILVKFDTDKDYKDLFVGKSKIKIADFGFATVLNVSKNMLAHSVLGTPAYIAPEIEYSFKHQKDRFNKNSINKIDYGVEIDIWSLGVLFFELLFNQIPFQTAEDKKLRLEKKQYTIPKIDEVSIESLDFLFMMLQYNKKDRLTIEQLAHHPFIVNDCETFTFIDKSKIQCSFSMERNGKNLWDLYGMKKPEIKNVNNQIDYSSLGLSGSISISNLLFEENFPEKENKKEQNIKSNIVVKNSNELIQKCFDEINQLFSYTSPKIIPIYPLQSKIDKYDLEIY